MKDLHNHILFAVDDGSKSLDESVRIIKQAVQYGYTDLILTPHYRSGQGYICDNNKKERLFKVLQNEVKKRNIPVHLYLGNEITVDGDLFQYLRQGKVLPINGSRYILIELPFHTRFAGIHDLIFKLRSEGKVPIIAHPERYEYYEDLEELKMMIQEGALFQINIASLYRKYGRNVQERAEELLRCHMVHFIGSDLHREGQTSYSRIGRVQEKVKKFTGSKSIVVDLVDRNIEKVINDEIIEPYKIKKPRKFLRIFSRSV